MLRFDEMPETYADLIADSEACFADLRHVSGTVGRLERMAFLINARERSRTLEPELYFALVRRTYDLIRPCDAEAVARPILLADITAGTSPLPYTKRALLLYRHVREALQ